MDYPEDKGFKWHQTFDMQPMCAAEKYNISMETGLLVKNRHILWEIPWDHVNHDQGMKCHIFQSLFRHHGFIPTYCLDCWKVVVKPRTLQELYILRDIQRSMAELDPECYCKCGIEQRGYVPGIYGGYFYNRSRQQGEERYEQLKKTMSFPIILKRYCTEFEIKLGDSGSYNQPKIAREKEALFLKMLDPSLLTNPAQPAEFKEHVYHQWQLYGWKFGTPEDRRQIELDWNDGEPLHRMPRTY